MRRLNPHAPATDDAVIGRVRDERSTAETVEISADQGEQMTDRAMIGELVEALRGAREQLVFLGDVGRSTTQTLRDIDAAIRKAHTYVGGA